MRLYCHQNIAATHSSRHLNCCQFEQAMDGYLLQDFRKDEVFLLTTYRAFPDEARLLSYLKHLFLSNWVIIRFSEGFKVYYWKDLFTQA